MTDLAAVWEQARVVFLESAADGTEDAVAAAIQDMDAALEQAAPPPMAVRRWRQNDGDDTGGWV